MSGVANGLLQFAAGFGTGYLRQKERKEDRDREDEDRSFKREERDRQRKAWKKADDLDAAVTKASQPVEAQDATVYQPAVDDEGYDMPANPTAGRMAVAGQTFNDPQAAQAAVAAANTPQARMARVSEAYAGAGQLDKAQAVNTLRKQADTDQRETKLREAGSLLARGGWNAVPALYRRYDDGLEAKVEADKDGEGATVITMDKDGKEVGRQKYRDIPHLFETVAGQFDPKLWLESTNKRRDDDRAAARDAQTASYQGRMAAVAEQNADTNAAYRSDMADAATTRANAAAAKGAYERMPEAEKIAFQSINRQVETIQTEIIKAKAGGMADPAAIAELQAQSAGLQLRARTMLSKYQPEGGGAPRPDPLGLNAPPAAAGGASSTKVDPKEQAARDKDRVAIITAELNTARQAVSTAADPAARSRAVSDVAALERELAGLQRTQPRQQAAARMASTEGAAVQPTAQPAAAPAAASPPAAAPAPTAPPTALAVVEARIMTELAPLADRVRVARAQLQMAAKSGDQRATATYSANLQQAMNELNTAANQRLGNRAPAFLESVVQ